MTVKYVRLSVAIHGLDADKEAIELLVGGLKTATFAGLMGDNCDRFRFRNEFESDIEVAVEEIAAVDYATTHNRPSHACELNMAYDGSCLICGEYAKEQPDEL